MTVRLPSFQCFTYLFICAWYLLLWAMWNQETRKALKHSITLILPNSVPPSKNPSLNLFFFFLLSMEYLRAFEKALKSPLLSALNLGRERGPELVWKSRSPLFWAHTEPSQGEGCTENYSPLLLQCPPTPQTSCRGRKALIEHTRSRRSPLSLFSFTELRWFLLDLEELYVALIHQNLWKPVSWEHEFSLHFS